VNKTMTMAGVAAAALLLSAVTRADEPAKKAGPAAVFVPPADLKWADVPGMTGVKMATLTGNPAKGAGHFFVKFTPGFSAPEHHHTANHYVAVMQGTMVLGVDGKDHSLPTGSFFSFTGGKKHTTKCAEGGDCVVYIDSRGTWDVVPEAAAAAPAK
jgi:quercetin dioxygenase-like cupin family protein